MPAWMRELAASISTMALLTAIPVSAITPYSVYRLSGLPVSNSPNTTPVKAMGIVARISSG